MRPIGSKDKTKRKKKIILDGTNERNLIANYENGDSIKQLIYKYGVTKSFISNLFNKRNIKKRIDHSFINQTESVDNIELLKKNISGIYGIYFLWKYNKQDPLAASKINDIKIYIGSSCDIKQRMSCHIGELKNNAHNNNLLSNYFNNKDYQVKYCIIKKCSTEDIMREESRYQHQFNRSCLLNSWLATNHLDLLPWLKKTITLESYKNYKITDCGCWESISIHKSGYARLAVVAFKDWGRGEKKYFASHRVAYWEKYGEYPELIRHKCGNSKCRNPDHLEKGNHRDNALDKRGDFPHLFEQKWLEFDGDPVRLSEYFSDRWSVNQKWKDTKISFAIYDWERKLNLRKKYPEVLDSNENRRFSIEYQKKRGANR